uniref:Uncharacterized protein n=1 Tax=Caudovirus D_HF5_2C TaxID=3071196 RepID=A0AA96ELJ5_9CAUD|nr:hypothetical protein [Caudovirus D_HF5_2C]
MTMSKSIVIVICRSTLQEITYYDIKDIEIIYGEAHPVEFIVTEQSGVRHHYPAPEYLYELYKQIDEKLNTKIRIPDEKSSMFRNYNPKFDLSKGDVHEQ